MRDLHEVTSEELRWVRHRRLKLEFELRAGETVVATLAWTGRARALGAWAGGQYRFSREGWFRPRTLVRGAEDTGEPVATFAHRGGILTFLDGRLFRWKKPKRWTNERIWVDASATELIRFRPSAWRSPGSVTIQAEAAHHRELPLLLLLGQFLLVLAAQEAEEASSAAMVPIIGSG